MENYCYYRKYCETCAIIETFGEHVKYVKYVKYEK